MTPPLTLRGIIGPVTTPFTGRGDVDRDAFARNVRAHLSAGLTGIVVSGSTGEAPLLEPAERDALVETARPLIPTDRLLVAGVGAESTRLTQELAKRAARGGADAVLVIAPHYFGSAMTDAALRTHFLAVADASPVPVLLYNNPKYMHYRLAPALVRELSRHGNIVGMKDSTGERELFAQYLESQGPSFTVLTGHGGFLAEALAMGSPGGVIGASLFAPELCLDVADAVRRGDSAAAGEIQRRLTPLARVVVGELGPAGVKAALDCVGLDGGAPRPPLPPLTGGDVDRVRQLLREAEVTVGA